MACVGKDTGLSGQPLIEMDVPSRDGYSILSFRKTAENSPVNVLSYPGHCSHSYPQFTGLLDVTNLSSPAQLF